MNTDSIDVLPFNLTADIWRYGQGGVLDSRPEPGFLDFVGHREGDLVRVGTSREHSAWPPHTVEAESNGRVYLGSNPWPEFLFVWHNRSGEWALFLIRLPELSTGKKPNCAVLAYVPWRSAQYVMISAEGSFIVPRYKLDGKHTSYFPFPYMVAVPGPSGDRKFRALPDPRTVRPAPPALHPRRLTDGDSLYPKKGVIKLENNSDSSIRVRFAANSAEEGSAIWGQWLHCADLVDSGKVIKMGAQIEVTVELGFAWFQMGFWIEDERRSWCRTVLTFWDWDRPTGASFSYNGLEDSALLALPDEEYEDVWWHQVQMSLVLPGDPPPKNDGA